MEKAVGYCWGSFGWDVVWSFVLGYDVPRFDFLVAESVFVWGCGPSPSYGVPLASYSLVWGYCVWNFEVHSLLY